MQSGKFKVGDKVLVSGYRSNTNARLRPMGTIVGVFYSTPSLAFYNIDASISQMGDVTLVGIPERRLEAVK